MQVNEIKLFCQLLQSLTEQQCIKVNKMKTVTLPDEYDLGKINVCQINSCLLWTDADYRLEIKKAVNLINS